ncbi:hypothetical protein [Clostridium estertheticum]|uniref:hypothetical protein n=1 Tax=Clostridium estertheticum TaxID=238834 RepID=UPI001C7DE540|nr:hypothetical protein [Clostridium estertheticum]MBX4266553.1 hypothetical protein [Clostridium estertheticum]WLC88107.1 hypothetical protein KTC95_19130 [Clostridium estertheticum]
MVFINILNINYDAPNLIIIGDDTMPTSDIFYSRVEPIFKESPKKSKKGKTLKCWEHNGFHNKR